jgi:hypothetical protein
LLIDSFENTFLKFRKSEVYLSLSFTFSNLK